MLLVPEPQGGRSTVTTTSDEVLGRRSATPEMDGKVVISTMRKRSRVISAPVLLVKVVRTSTVPKVELLGGSMVGSRTKFGGASAAAHESSSEMLAEPSSTPGPERFCGPGAPSRWPAPALVPLVSTKMK